ncbi:MAG: septum site-determining protein MinD [Oscillospiraceae bacterium]|nr:septum site-determining protein MinD [Oscillospiraceae bacterium]
MGKIIAVVSGKGGTGKTSFTANTGLALAALGYHVLCLDCDITLRNLDLTLGLGDSALMDFSDVLSGRCTLHEAVVSHPKYPSLDLLAAPTGGSRENLAPEQMKDLFRQIREEYSYCLVDSPAGLGLGFHLATDYADSAVVVTTTDQTALRDAQRTVMELDRFPTGSVHLVVGRVQRRMLRALHTTIDDAIDTAGLPLLGVIPEDGDMPYALNRGLPLRDCNDYSARAYENIAKRIAGRRVPLMKI